MEVWDSAFFSAWLLFILYVAQCEMLFVLGGCGMKSTTIVALCFAALGLMSSCESATITIDFDEINNPASTPFNVLLSGYTSQGYTITPQGPSSQAFIVSPPASTMTGGIGNKFLTWAPGTGPNSITISRSNPLDGTFNLDRLLLGTLVDITPNSANYSITSSLPPIIGTANGVNVLTPSLMNLTSVTINWLSGDSLAIDNIVLSDFIAGPAAVPEPATTAVLGLGSLAMVFRRLRRRTSVVA